jgi:hypothetical protein
VSTEIAAAPPAAYFFAIEIGSYCAASTPRDRLRLRRADHRLERRERGARVDRRRGQANTCAHGLRSIGNEQRRSRVKHDRITRGARLTLQHATHDRGVRGRITAEKLGERGFANTEL